MESTPRFTLEHLVGPYTASNAGTFSITHNFGVFPKQWRAFLVCLVAEENYSVNDVIEMSSWQNGAGVSPFTFTFTGTTAAGRWANSSTNLRANNKTTGAIASLTYANWDVYFYLWA